MLSNKGYHDLEVNGTSERPSSSRRHTILLAALVVFVGILAFSTLVYAVHSLKDKTAPHIPDPQDPFSDGLQNMNTVKQNLISYYEGPKYAEHVQSLASGWTARFENYFESRPAPAKDALPDAVVFDIDETLINNYEEVRREDFTSDTDKWNAWVEEARAPIIPGSKSFYDFLISKNVVPILITGRHENQREATVRNLDLVDVKNYDVLILRSPEEKHLTASVYKANHRKELSKKYNIIGCIGDQFSDCVGGYQGFSMKLPNFMYYIA